MESSTPVNVSSRSASKKATSTASAITRFASATSSHGSGRLGAALLALTLAATLPGPHASAVDDVLEARRNQLQSRFDVLVAREDSKYVKAAIEHARRGLRESSVEVEDPEARSRALAIAEAATVLAERQLARRAVQEELFATQRRLTATRERANAQRRVLEALMKERASLARAEEVP